MIKDMLKIINLISDLISLFHPTTLDIRYLFHYELNDPAQRSTRDVWEKHIAYNQYTLMTFLKNLLSNSRFRFNVIKILQNEKEKMTNEL